jgi:hypothetical protein
MTAPDPSTEDREAAIAALRAVWMARGHFSPEHMADAVLAALAARRALAADQQRKGEAG